MARLGIAVIGQAPRADIAALFRAALPHGTEIVLRGCLDELSDAEVDGLTPQSGADTLYTRLRGERDVKISKAAVIERAPATLDRLRAVVEGAFEVRDHEPPDREVEQPEDDQRQHDLDGVRNQRVDGVLRLRLRGEEKDHRLS